MKDYFELLEKVHMKQHPEFEVGDTIAVHTIVREGDKKRIQIFRGIVLARRGTGTKTTFTVRKVSLGVGVEKIFPLYTPNISKIVLIKKGKVRKSKLYYMRNRVGKRALKIGEGVFTESAILETIEKKADEGETETTDVAEKEETPPQKGE